MGCFGHKSKKYRATIVLLDETEIVHEIMNKTMGEDLMQFVFNYLNLLETAYFGLRYINKIGESRWLDPTKKVIPQIKGVAELTFYFGVKFYASDPCKLQEEITRYQFVLQIKQDIFQGRLLVTPELGIELFALSLQSELGDYDLRRHDKHYVSEFRFLPNQTPELEQKVAEKHKTLMGQVSSTVEMTFLEKVKWLDMYGVDLHVVMGEDSVEYFLCLSPSGIIVMKNGKKISNYFWPRITKVYFKGKYFMLRVINKANEENTYAFELLSKETCKYLWKCCIEHHAFFRLTQVKDVAGIPVNIFRLGSKHRYSGRTEQQIRADMKQIKRPPPAVVRMPSRRYPKRIGEPDGAEAEVQVKEQNYKPLKSKDDLAITQPVPILNLYRSISTPAELSTIDTSNQLSNTDTVNKIAPWENPNQKGLFSNSSRQSLCSSLVSERRHNHRSHHKVHSPSLNSEVSLEYRRKRHKSKRNSDNESDVSKSSRGSKTSKSSRNSHRKSRNYDSTVSDTDSCNQRRSRRYRSYRSDLVDSNAQWKFVQHQEKNNCFQNAVVRDLSHRKSGYLNSGIDTESEITLKHRKKQRRHSRSRSRSPDTKRAISDDVKKHIKYNLIDPCSLTEEEKRDIKYTKIESTNEVVKVRYSPAPGRPRYKLEKIPSRSSLEKTTPLKVTPDEAPPPYSVNNLFYYTKHHHNSHSNVMSDSSNGSRASIIRNKHKNSHNSTSNSKVISSRSNSRNRNGHSTTIENFHSQNRHDISSNKTSRRDSSSHKIPRNRDSSREKGHSKSHKDKNGSFQQKHERKTEL